MYRIIGITKETDTLKPNMLKVIKKEALDTAYYWYNVSNQDIKWNESDLYKGLNGISGGTYNNLFIGNIAYVPNGWENKIEKVTWKYGDVYNSSWQTATNITPTQMLQTEQSLLTTVNAKIGLMYMSDYYFGLSKIGVNCGYGSSNTYPQCATSWMHLKQNDASAPDTNEWTMIRFGINTYNCSSWFISSDGYVVSNYISRLNSVRPVFYIVPEIEISGSGTITDPFIIAN